MNMKYIIIAFQVLALTLLGFAAPPPAEDEPPITSKEELVERLSAIPMDELRRADWSERQAILNETRHRLSTLVERHPEIIPFLPQLRDHPNSRVRKMVFENELRVPELRDKAIQRVASSNESWRSKVMQYVGPLLHDRKIADQWLDYAKDRIKDGQPFDQVLKVLEEAPPEIAERLEATLEQELVSDLRSNRISAGFMPHVLKSLRERPEIDRDALLDAVIAAETKLEEPTSGDSLENLFYRRAKNSLLITRVLLDDQDALDTIITNAMTPRTPEREHYIALLDDLPPTARLMNVVLKLLSDTEQVGEIPPPPHGGGGSTPVLARDMAAFVVREWFKDAPGAKHRNYLWPVPKEQINELKVWLSLKLVDVQVPLMETGSEENEQHP